VTVSDATDRADRDTLERIARTPGCKRRDTWVVKAAVTRLIRAGHVQPPTTSGKLYLTIAGWRELAGSCEVIDNTRGLGFTHACIGSWNLLGRNAAGHDVFVCDYGRHVAVQPSRDDAHQCVTSAEDCTSADLAGL
jgi:hypothetical protein